MTTSRYEFIEGDRIAIDEFNETAYVLRVEENGTLYIYSDDGLYSYIIPRNFPDIRVIS